jgi:hypothetical protein
MAVQSRMGSRGHCQHTRPSCNHVLLRTSHLASAVHSKQTPTHSISTPSSQQAPYPLEAACFVSKTVIGLNPQGYRGLLSASSIIPGEVVLSIPLHNILQVPRQLTQPEMQSATAAALATWQQQHWELPQELASLILSPNVTWESKLVAWLLYLKAAAPEGTLWHSYIQSLPAAADAITFCSYSEQQAEQLQFSVWKVGLVCAHATNIPSLHTSSCISIAIGVTHKSGALIR